MEDYVEEEKGNKKKVDGMPGAKTRNSWLLWETWMEWLEGVVREETAEASSSRSFQGVQWLLAEAMEQKQKTRSPFNLAWCSFRNNSTIV